MLLEVRFIIRKLSFKSIIQVVFIQFLGPICLIIWQCAMCADFKGVGVIGLYVNADILDVCEEWILLDLPFLILENGFSFRSHKPSLLYKE